MKIYIIYFSISQLCTNYIRSPTYISPEPPIHKLPLSEEVQEDLMPLLNLSAMATSFPNILEYLNPVNYMPIKQVGLWSVLRIIIILAGGLDVIGSTIKPLSKVLHKGINITDSPVSKINADQNTIETIDGDRFTYD